MTTRRKDHSDSDRVLGVLGHQIGVKSGSDDTNKGYAQVCDYDLALVAANQAIGLKLVKRRVVRAIPVRWCAELCARLGEVDNPNVAFQIDAMQDMGVHIAMDDFGTGFCSLVYLWKFGFDRIKIDRSFVSGLSDNLERS